MTKILLKLNALILILLGLAPVTAQEHPSALRSTDRFNGTTRVRVRNAQGQSQLVEVNVRIQNWAIVGGQKLTALPLQMPGFLVVQLRAGELTTVIAGNRQERKEDEFWTVPAGIQLGVETGDDTASLQTIVVSER